MTIGIYKITSPIGAVYVGQSINIEHRIKRYKRLDCVNQVKVHNSIVKYGFENHKIEIIKECKREDLNFHENYYGVLLNALSPFNLNSQLPSRGKKTMIYSDELRKRLSEAKKGRRLPDSAYENRIYGPMSEETKKKISLSNMGKPKHSDESKRKMSLLRIGRKTSEQTKLKQSISHSRGNGSSAKMVLNIETGIFYMCIIDAIESEENEYKWLARKLSGKQFNNTKFIFV